MLALEFMSTVLSVFEDVPNPAPIDPTGGSPALSVLLGIVKYGVLAISAVAAVCSGAFFGFGKLSSRPDAAEKGKVAFIYSLLGVIVGFTAIPIVNAVANAVS